jgi:uncharacterized phage-like protein YoqJ
MILAGTGHRPNYPKMGGYNIPNPQYNNICQQTTELIQQLQPEKIISGMALGFDLWLAKIAIDLQIPLIAAVPFAGQETMWQPHQKYEYQQLLSQANEVKIVSPGTYSAAKMQIRNQWMVNHCDTLLACYDPEITNGGTYNCIQYAKQQKKQIVYLNL